MKFKDIYLRITGISVPIGGIQWTPPVDQCRLAQQVLDRVADRRVLYVPLYRENEQACRSSALDLRQDMGVIVDASPPKSHVYNIAKAIQRASRTFMSKTDPLNFSSNDPATAIATRAIFEGHLIRFRERVGTEIANAAVAYGLDIEDELAAIIRFTKPD